MAIDFSLEAEGVPVFVFPLGPFPVLAGALPP
jgi:hypothetical protein